MSRAIAFPVFGAPPTTYDTRYMGDLVRSLNQLTTILGNPGEGRNTQLVLTALQTNDSGLEAGAIYLQGDALHVSKLNVAVAYSAGLALTLGDVTVSII